MLKNEFIKFRVSKEQKEKWQTYSKELGISLTALITLAVEKMVRDDK